MANALAYSGGSGYAGTYLVSGSGADVTLSLYGYALSSGVYAYSYGSSFDYSLAWTDGVMSNGTYGLSVAYSTVGGSYDQAEEFSTNYYILTNNSTTNYEFASLSLNASTTNSAYSDGNGYAESLAAAELVNLSSGDEFFVESEALSGANQLSVTEGYWYESIGGYTWSETDYTAYSADSSVWAGFGWGGSYGVWLAPGQTDLIATEAGSLHEAYSTTPAPAAIAPFALGLLAALRRRKRA
jgi:MYXO-CTERM domain-containing protein